MTKCDKVGQSKTATSTPKFFNDFRVNIRRDQTRRKINFQIT